MSLRQALAGLLLAVCLWPAGAAIDVNRVTRGELEAVKGVGPRLSGRIIDARRTGPFRDWPDLQSRVKGIGTASAEKLSAAGLTVDGETYTASPYTRDRSKAPRKVRLPRPAAADPPPPPRPPPPGTHRRGHAAGAAAARTRSCTPSPQRPRPPEIRAAGLQCPKNVSTSSRRRRVSARPSAISSRVYGASNSR